MQKGQEIFARENSKMSLLPSKKYPLWIDAFEKMVSEAQKRLEEARHTENLYTNVATFFADNPLTNETKVTAGDHQVFVALQALPTDHIDDLIAYFCKFNKYLHEKGHVITDDNMPFARLNSWTSHYYTWTTNSWAFRSSFDRTRDRFLSITITFPEKGIRGLKIVRSSKIVQYEDHVYTASVDQSFSTGHWKIPTVDTNRVTNAKVIVDSDD